MILVTLIVVINLDDAGVVLVVIRLATFRMDLFTLYTVAFHQRCVSGT